MHIVTFLDVAVILVLSMDDKIGNFKVRLALYCCLLYSDIQCTCIGLGGKAV